MPGEAVLAPITATVAAAEGATTAAPAVAEVATNVTTGAAEAVTSAVSPEIVTLTDTLSAQLDAGPLDGINALAIQPVAPEGALGASTELGLTGTTNPTSTKESQSVGEGEGEDSTNPKDKTSASAKPAAEAVAQNDSDAKKDGAEVANENDAAAKTGEQELTPDQKKIQELEARLEELTSFNKQLAELLPELRGVIEIQLQREIDAAAKEKQKKALRKILEALAAAVFSGFIEGSKAGVETNQK